MTWEDRAVNLDDIQVDNTNQYQQVLTGVKFFADQSPTRFNNESIHLNLKIRMTDFNFETGKLFVDHGAHAWYRKIDKEFLGHKSRSHIPMRTKSKNTSISKTNHFVEFTPTGIFEDSQNKVPAHSVGDGCEWNSNIQMEISFPHARSKISTENLDISTRAKSRNTMVSNGDQYVAFTHTDIAKDVGQTTIPFLDSQNVVTKVPTPLVGAGLYYKSSPGYGGFIGLKIITYDFTKHL
ncbi:hypothetical protein QE152_g6086 [Popillia japonica]|uniref:Uncharacterized protein n=1 Tax=Popillia japonica TaxID=7064 RepID=A0AAW1MJP5_POPJA